MEQIEYTSDRRTVKEFLELVEKQYISLGKRMQETLANKAKENGQNFNPRPYMKSQRFYVWKPWMASNLFLSFLISDDSVTEMVLYRSDSKSQFRKTIDGQQRGTSLYFITTDKITFDMSRCKKKTFVIEGEIHDVSELHGKKFSELPELWRDIFYGRHISWRCANNCTDDEAEEIYMMINTGTKSLTPPEIRRAIIGAKNLKTLEEIKDADWWLHATTPASLCGNWGDEILSHVITIIDSNFTPVSLEAENINNVIYKYREDGFSEDIIAELHKINFYLNDVTEIWINNQKEKDEIESKGRGRGRISGYNTYRFSFLNKTNTVTLMIAASIAMKHNISTNDFAEWAYNFFNPNIPNLEYRQACGIDCEGKKASDKECVGDRIRLIYTSLTSKFGTAVVGDINNEQKILELKENEVDDEDNDIYPNTDHIYVDEEIKRLMSGFSDPFEGEDLQEAVGQ